MAWPTAELIRMAATITHEGRCQGVSVPWAGEKVSCHVAYGHHLATVFITRCKSVRTRFCVHHHVTKWDTLFTSHRVVKTFAWKPPYHGPHLRRCGDWITSLSACRAFWVIFRILVHRSLFHPALDAPLAKVMRTSRHLSRLNHYLEANGAHGVL